jgi:hypothetical protein
MVTTALSFPDRNNLPPPYVDERLVEPETRDEMLDGRLIHAVAATPAHGDEHFEVDYLVRSSLAPGYTGSTDLLTRAGPDSDFATATCIRRSGIDPRTGSRYLEELAFGVVDAQSMAALVTRAQKLSARGVRRIFAVVIDKHEVREWSSAQRGFVPLPRDGSIEDPALVCPVPVRAFFDPVAADDALVDALEAEQPPRLMEMLAKSYAEGHADGRAEAYAESRAEAYAEVIPPLCDLLHLPFGPREREMLDRMDADGRAALFAYLETERRWPND